ncbi:hypothetical protein [Thiolapillus sp.]|uniref:hypothetical protein n=1 Tax=Thiolapillus sp. TaxID=2017437 RepID=UPI003AF67F2F
MTPDDQIEHPGFVLQGDEHRIALAGPLAHQHQPGGAHHQPGLAPFHFFCRHKAQLAQRFPQQRKGVLAQAQAQVSIVCQHFFCHTGMWQSRLHFPRLRLLQQRQG